MAAVLTGKVLQRGDALLISAELIDVENGWQLWGEKYRRQLRISSQLKRTLPGRSRKTAAQTDPGEKEDIYQAIWNRNHHCIKGRFHWAKRTADVSTARSSISVKPGSGALLCLAYAGLAEGYIPQGFYCHLAPRTRTQSELRRRKSFGN